MTDWTKQYHFPFKVNDRNLYLIRRYPPFRVAEFVEGSYKPPFRIVPVHEQSYWYLQSQPQIIKMVWGTGSYVIVDPKMFDVQYTYSVDLGIA